MNNNLHRKSRWSEKDLLLLKEKFPTATKQDLICLFPNRTWNGINTTARANGLSRSVYWQAIKSRDKNILELLKTKSPPQVAKELNLKDSHVYARMYKHRVRPIAKIANNNLKRILDDSPESYYWIGFILADGCFSGGKSKKRDKQYNSLTFTLARKDMASVRKFAKFIGAKINIVVKDKTHDALGIHVNDIWAIRTLMDKLGIESSQAKTYNPPSKLFALKPDHLFCLIVGYTDGDGCIMLKKQKNGKFPFMTYTAYKAWMPIFERFEPFLYEYFGLEKNSKAKHIGIVHYENMPIEKRDRTVKWDIPDNRLIKAMKRKAIELKLPIMARKWSKVNINTEVKSRKEMSDERKQLVRKYLSEGIVDVNEIILLTGLTRSCIVWIKNQWKEEKKHVA